MELMYTRAYQHIFNGNILIHRNNIAATSKLWLFTRALYDMVAFQRRLTLTDIRNKAIVYDWVFNCISNAKNRPMLIVPLTSYLLINAKSRIEK